MDVLQGLRTFCAVAEERSFTRGAERCGQPQPVASRRIAALERHLGATLIVRTSRHVALSPEGERLLPLAKELVARADSVEGLFRTPRPELLLAVPAGLTARARATIRRGLSHRSVDFTSVAPRVRAERLRTGGAHVALLPAAPDEAQVVVPLGVAHADHDAGPPFFLEQLRRPVLERDVPPPAIHVLPEDDVPMVRDQLREACYATGLRADQVAVGTMESESWTRVHERGDVVLASAPEADREGLAWSELVRPRMTRGYRLAGGSDLRSEARRALIRRLATGLGGEVVALGA